MDIVRSLGRDLVRVGRAERALERAAHLQAQRQPDVDKGTVAELARLKKLGGTWRMLADKAAAMKDMQDCTIIKQFERTAEVLKQMAEEEKDASIAGAMTEAHMELTGLARRLRTPGATVIKENAADTYGIICRHVVAAIDATLAKLEEQVDSVREIEEILAEIPDEKLVRRFDRYVRTTQGAVLRQLQILKELRSLEDAPTPT